VQPIKQIYMLRSQHPTFDSTFDTLTQ